MHEFRLRFHWVWLELTIFQHWFWWLLGAEQATSHYLNQWWLAYWHIYASHGLNELCKILNALMQRYGVDKCNNITLNKFQRLVISYGRITKIDSNAFSGLPNLTVLFMNYCELKTPPKLYSLKRNLKFLFLDGNCINDFSLDYFHDFLSLENLDVGWNSLTSIPAINELAPHLKKSSFSSNLITDVEGRWRENDTVYDSLTRLWLDGNNIKSIDAGIMKALPSIRYLGLAKNFITHFEDPIRYLNGISSQCTVYLGKNPLDCGSHLVWVFSVQMVLVYATCNTPRCVTGMALHTMSEYMLNPSPDTGCRWCHL